MRIVYVPPMSLGCFGGDTDNFEWPRHTADFTLLRAYVSPDGAAAEYNEANVPYESLVEMDEVNGRFKATDLVLVVGGADPRLRHRHPEQFADGCTLVPL